MTGKISPTEYTHDEAATAIVDAGAAMFRSPDYPVLAGVKLAHAAHKAGIPERTASHKWKVGELHQAIVHRVLADGDPAAQFDVHDQEHLARELLDDPDYHDLDVVAEVVNAAWPLSIDDPTVRAVQTLGAYIETDSPMGDQIREGLMGVCDAWGDGAFRILQTIIVRNTNRITVRDDINLEDIAQLMPMITLAAGFLARVRAASGREPFAPDLPGQLARAIAADVIRFDNETRCSSCNGSADGTASR